MRVVHAERLPDVLLQVAAERLLGELLDDQPQHVEAEAVVPDRARLVAAAAPQPERSMNSAPVMLLGGRRAAARKELVHRRGAAAAIDQARRVPEQILDRDRTRRRDALDDVLLLRVEHRDLLLGELRKILRHRIVDQQPALLVELQRRDRRHRLGHRRDVEDRVGAHRHTAGLVEEAVGLEMHEPAAPHDREHAARQLVARDLGLDPLPDQRQPLGRHADRFRLGARQRVRSRCALNGQHSAHDAKIAACNFLMTSSLPLSLLIGG